MHCGWEITLTSTYCSLISCSGQERGCTIQCSRITVFLKIQQCNGWGNISPWSSAGTCGSCRFRIGTAIIKESLSNLINSSQMFRYALSQLILHQRLTVKRCHPRAHLRTFGSLCLASSLEFCGRLLAKEKNEHQTILVLM